MKNEELKKIFFKLFEEIRNVFSKEKFDILEKEILKQAKLLKFDMDLFSISSEFLDEDGFLSDNRMLKNISIYYNSERPFIFVDWI